MLGVGDVNRADIVKREVIHQLCISPLAHSELAKALPEDVSYLSCFTIYRILYSFALKMHTVHQTEL